MTRTPDYGALLLQWLPAVWRERDTGGQLRDLLQVYGELLDAMHNTVMQLYDDGFAAEDPAAASTDAIAGGRCQDWLLPYLAQLLDVRLISPDADGRHAEIRDAIAWRQRKGTRVSMEGIAEAVGRFEVEVQEGWKRMAITPRVDRSLLPERVYGEEPLPLIATPAMRAGHPGLPAATLDLRYCSRAVQCDENNPAARRTRFGGETRSWRQVWRHGAPCSPGSFQDVSPRTPDLRLPPGRRPTIARGGLHPRRALIYTAPNPGFFDPAPDSARWSDLTRLIDEAADIDVGDWGEDERVTCDLGNRLELVVGRARWNGIDLPLIQLRGLGAMPARLRGVAELDKPAVYRFDNLWLDNRVHMDAGVVEMTRSAARELHVSTIERGLPVIHAKGCLFKRLLAPRGLVRLVHATVLERMVAERLQASDSILLPRPHRDLIDDDVPEDGCLRFSRVFYIPKPPDPMDTEALNDPVWISQGKRSALRVHEPSCTDVAVLFWNQRFGDPGCGVLRPEADPALRNGAEDGGEMGAYHDLHLVLREEAVLDKLAGFLPLGIEAVLVSDLTLACTPPEQ
jgi:hypothetical protein